MAVLSAENQLRAMVQASVDPTLSDDEIETLLALASVVDADGLIPSDAGWTATYDLNRAAAEGWRWKAGKVAPRFDFGTDVSRFSRAQLHKHCMEQAADYARRISGVTVVPGAYADSSVDPVTAS